MVTAYPTELPLESIGLLKDAILGRGPGRNAVIHAAWEVAGYGLGYSMPVEVVMGAGQMGELEALDAALNVSDDPEAKAVLGPIVITTLINLSVRLIKKYLES